MRNYAIEADALSQPTTGVQRYLRAVCRGMLQQMAEESSAERLVLLYRHKRRPDRSGLPAGERLRWQLYHRRLWPLHRPYSVLFSPFHRFPDWRIPVVGTLYDFYEEQGIGVGDPAEALRAIEHRRRLVQEARALLCISECTRRDLEQLYPHASAKALVIPLAADEHFVPASAPAIADLRRRLGLTRPYLLFVGADRPNKNLARLLRAFYAAPECRDLELVIAGPRGGGDADPAVAEALAAKPATHSVRRLGYVAEVDLPALYSGARAFLFPSLREGFGLPILEAMRCATPVLTSEVSSCAEIAGRHAALVAPTEIDSIVAGLRAVLARTADEIEKARHHALGYNWRRTASETLAVLRRHAEP